MIRKLFAAVVMVAVLCAGGVVQAEDFWGSGSADWGNSGAVLFKLDTATGNVELTYEYSGWSYIMGVTYAPGNVLYAAHNTTDDLYNFKIAKVDAGTGAVLSDTPINTLSGTDIPIWNSLEYFNGDLYAVENNSWGSSYTAYQYRGYIYQVDLDGNGDPASAILGSYIGGYPAPDGALAYYNGTWYASDWRTNTSSWIRTTTDIMNTDFTATASTSPVGLFAGWDFEADGDLLGVSWYYDFNVYEIDKTTGVATALFNIGSQLPTSVTMLGGLSNTAVPEPTILSLLALGLIGIAGARKKFRQ